MTIDVAGMLFGMQSPVYADLAVDATLQAATGPAHALRVIDDTRRTTDVEGNASVQTVLPGAFARMVELAAAGLIADDCVDGLITFNGATWQITSFEMRGSPQGENAGEVRFILASP
jgi:hypothetical protein